MNWAKLTKRGLAIATSLGMAVTLIAGFEGKSNTAYLDLVKVPTICYGHTRDVKLGDIKSDTECEAMLLDEVRAFDTAVMKRVKTPLEDHQRAAFVSFAYNIGEGAFSHSTALKRLNAGDVKGACNAIATRLYINGRCNGYGCGWSGGRQIRGLQLRREAERDMCLGVTK